MNENSTYKKIKDINDSFRKARNKVERLKPLLFEILNAFQCHPMDKKYRYGEIYDVLFGREKLEFNSSSPCYWALKDTTEEELTNILNAYAPKKLKVEEISINEYTATVYVILDGIEWP